MQQSVNARDDVSRAYANARDTRKDAMTKPEFKEVVPYAKHSPEPRISTFSRSAPGTTRHGTSWPAAHRPCPRSRPCGGHWTTRSPTRPRSARRSRGFRPSLTAPGSSAPTCAPRCAPHSPRTPTATQTRCGTSRDELDARESPRCGLAGAEVTNYRKMRRQARLARRSGLQPMMVINTGDGCPDTVGVLLARWAWRYRSELAPVGVAAALVASAWWLHHTRPRWWALVAVLAGVAVWAVAMFGARWRFPALTERVYAAVTVYLGGTWLSAATAIGPFRPPLPQALVLGGLVLSVPWWAHRRRRAKVRLERKLQAWPDIARAIGLAGTEVMSATVDVWGWRARFRLARGQTLREVIAKIPLIESGLGTFRGAVRVYPTPDDHRQPVRNPRAGRGPARRGHSVARPVRFLGYPAHRHGAIRGCLSVPGAFRPPAWHLRRHHRVRQERRTQCAHG